MFALQRPLSADTVNQTLRAAYGLIVRERRRYFRCPMAVPAFVRAGQQEELMYQTVNVSEGGIAISARARVDSDLPAAVRFTLPERSTQLLAETRVRWRNAGGLVGLEFISLALPHKTELQEWLARKLDETLPENVAALFRTVGRS
jgi:c-di-GMP-binding flagellar brake protein YcgR